MRPALTEPSPSGSSALASALGVWQAQLVEVLIGAFREFDTDNSGRLERDEIVKCLQSLTLGSTKLTPREVCVPRARSPHLATLCSL